VLPIPEAEQRRGPESAALVRYQHNLKPRSGLNALNLCLAARIVAGSDELRQEDGMTYAAIALAILGFVVGVMFRFRVLLPILLALLLVSIVFALAHELGFLGVVSTVMVAQAIVQASYFLGLVARGVFSTHRMRRVL
jgi:hypothetical protein